MWTFAVIYLSLSDLAWLRLTRIHYVSVKLC